MKTLLTALIILFLGLGFTAHAQQPDCKRFRSGSFKLVDSLVGTFYIKRQGNVQIETKEGDPDAYEFAVKWIDDCTYTLTPGEAFLKKFPQLSAKDVLTVQIIKTTANSYTQISSSTFSNMKITKEIFKVE